MAADRPTIYFASQRDWEAWLEQNHEDSPGVWIKMAKKASGIASLNHKEALEEALCFGWIDGQARSLDEQYTLRMFTPRRPRSTWSKINVGHIERLATEGRIRPAGQREVDAAKADGRWDAAYSSQATIEVPGDFARPRIRAQSLGVLRLPEQDGAVAVPVSAHHHQEAGDPRPAYRAVCRVTGRGKDVALRRSTPCVPPPRCSPSATRTTAYPPS